MAFFTTLVVGATSGVLGFVPPWQLELVGCSSIYKGES
jgi:hypothetical protein